MDIMDYQLCVDDAKMSESLSGEILIGHATMKFLENQHIKPSTIDQWQKTNIARYI